MAEPGRPAVLRIEVVYSPAPRTVWQWAGEVTAGTTVAEALRCSGLLAAHPELDLDRLALGIWGHVQPPDQVLRDRDRVEVYRGLLIDPKEARRRRFLEQQSPSKPGKPTRRTSGTGRQG